MPLFEPILAARYFRPMLQALERAPPSLRTACIKAAGLGHAKTISPTAVTTIDQLEAMLAIVFQDPQCQSFGFDAGMHVTLLDHGPLAPALMRCKTLEERLQMQAHYARLISPILSLRFTRYADRGEFVIRPAAALKPVGMRTMLEMSAVAGHHNIPAHALRPLAPYHVYLSIDTPPYLARYKALRGVQFHFAKSGLPEAKLVIPDAMLRTPLHTEQGAVESTSTEQLDILQKQIGRSTQCSQWARMMLMEAEACQPTAQELADLLSVSRRTFERALAQENISYRDLARQVRHERACEQLKNENIAVSQIAYHLGYSDIAAFSHAFKRMAHCNPSSYRTAHVKK